MRSEWVICRKCSLKFRVSEGTCPRCETPADATQVRWSEQRGPAAPEEGSGLAIAVPVGVVLAAIGSFLFLVTFGGLAAGELTAALVVAGLLAIGVGWAWAVVLAWRVSVPAFVFALLTGLVSVLVKKEWKTAGLMLAGFGSIGAGVFFAPAGFFHTTKETRVERLCLKKSGEDCACVGTKTVVLMTPEDRAGELDAESPALRELMLTASQLCLKDRLVGKCVAGKQGSELQCLCIVDKAVNAFTPNELEGAFAGGTAPGKYGVMRAECTKR